MIEPGAWNVATGILSDAETVPPSGRTSVAAATPLRSSTAVAVTVMVELRAHHCASFQVAVIEGAF